ncbi:MAG: hypothetical protein J5886_07560, partial [Bacteroidales bacterium]|nr:hypothetical protein [Bacteroidales bacterium]
SDPLIFHSLIPVFIDYQALTENALPVINASERSDWGSLRGTPLIPLGVQGDNRCEYRTPTKKKQA